jgi:adenine C2-methylase RlmN of 23S rRNA A2503 and tRNA A37
MKKFTQWSGEITMRTSGRAARMRLPSSENAEVRLSFSADASFSQLRTIIGPWLDA